jgi:hypothetical protein
VKRNTT